MNNPIEYRRMERGDENRTYNFVAEVFTQYTAPEFSQEGIEEFLKYIQPDTLANHLKHNHFGLIASAGAEIAGVVVVRDNRHVALFFVGTQHQRQGIGRELIRKAVAQCKRRHTKLMQITVNASPNSIGAYKALNFEPTDKEQCVNGIRFIPMVLHLQQAGGS